MARPRKGTIGHEEAKAKWLETMQARYGGEEGLSKFMAESGAKGGRNGHYGGFNIGDSAKTSGTKGGKLSRRGFKLIRKVYLTDSIEAVYKSLATGEIEKVVIKK